MIDFYMDGIRWGRLAYGELNYTTYDLMNNPRSCDAYRWIGQSFKYCDDCGQPYWEHSHVYVSKRGIGGYRRKSISRANAARMKEKWDT